MMSRWLDRMESWSQRLYRLYRLDPERVRREADLRSDLLRRLLLAAGASALLYLGLGMLGIVAGSFFPYDAVELLATAAGCAWLVRRGHAANALVFPLVVFSHTASSLIARYGVASPAVALLLPTIVVCGLLVGGYFLGTWTVICGILVLYIGWLTESGSQPADLLKPVLFWWAMFALVGWLVHLFSSHLERLLQLERGQKLAVLRTLGLLATGPHLSGLLGRTLEVVREQLGARSIALWLKDDSGDCLTLVDGKPSTVETTRLAVADLPDWKSLVESRRSMRLTHSPSVPSQSAWSQLVPAGSGEVIILPLAVGSSPTGLLAVGCDPLPRHAEERMELAEALALQVSLLLELVGLAERDRQAMIVEERNRMARDIHDTLAQGFTGIVIQLNAAEEMLSADRTRAREHMATARELARTSLQEARRSVWALRPASQARESLATALERSARTLTAGTETEVVIERDGDSRWLNTEAEWEVLRIGQEAVTNAVRHSACHKITVRVAQAESSLRLDVLDDGQGGMLPGVGTTGLGGLGLRGMRERAERIGGRLEVHSPAGGPTRVTLLVPGE
jgi:signal transduction histidine kinase